MLNIFLSASVPLPNRDQKFYSTADVVAIREAVKAVVSEVIPRGFLVFGGHPAITPLISMLIRNYLPHMHGRFVLYQSAYFERRFPAENDEFINTHVVSATKQSKKRSLATMRNRMIADRPFNAGIFIGGMEGVLEEYKLFRKFHPTAPVWPIGSTGAAAKLLLDEEDNSNRDDLNNEVTYATLFRELLDTLPKS